MKCRVQLDNGNEHIITACNWDDFAFHIAILSHIGTIRASVLYSDVGLDVVEIKYKYRKKSVEKRAITYVKILHIEENSEY